MNAKTRKEIKDIALRLDDIQYELTIAKEVTFEYLTSIRGGDFEKIKEEVRQLAEDEREKADNMFERFSGTEQYDAVDMAASFLEDAADSLESIESGDSVDHIMEAIDDALESLNDARE